MKKIMAVLLAMVITLTLTPLTPLTAFAEAESVIASGSCGNGVTWKVETTFVSNAYKLTISGVGSMDDFSESDEHPWEAYEDRIKTVIIENGVGRIGDHAFYDCSELDYVIFHGDTPPAIAENAFVGVDGEGIIVHPEGKEDAYEDILEDAGVSTSTWHARGPYHAEAMPITGVKIPIVGEYPDYMNFSYDWEKYDEYYGVGLAWWHPNDGEGGFDRPYERGEDYCLILELTHDFDLTGLYGGIIDYKNGLLPLDGFTVNGQQAELYTGGGPGEISMIDDLMIMVTFRNTADFVPVTAIRDVPLTAAVGHPHTLSGTVVPDNATYKNIVWSIKDAGGTGAMLADDGKTITGLASAGTVTVTATVPLGGERSPDPEYPDDPPEYWPYQPYTQDFEITVSTPAAPAIEVSVDGTVTITGENVPNREFTFVLTQLGVPNPIVIQTTASTTDRNFSFTIPNLSNGEYYFEIKEDTSNVPDGWTYDTASYPVRVVVEDGKAMVCYSNGTIEGSISTGKEQTIEIEPDHVISTGGNVHNEVVGIPCYDHSNHVRTQMHYRSVVNANGEVVIGAAYCIDYLVLEVDNDNDPSTGDYAPHFDYDDLADHFMHNDGSDHPHNGGIDQILWLGRNGFMSEVAGQSNGSFGVDDAQNNLGEIQELTEVETLTAAEAYSATQLAIWHYTNGVVWVAPNVEANNNNNEREITNQNVYDAYVALCAKADEAVGANGEDLITELSATVNFDLSNANYTNGLYGPVKLAVDLAPADFSNPASAPVIVTPVSGVELLKNDKTTPLTSSDPIYAGNSFYVRMDNPPISGTKLADATINAPLSALDMYALKSASGWDVQAVIGAGKSARNIQANASLYVGKADTGGIVFNNRYDTSPSSASTNIPQTGDDSNITAWLIALLMSVLGILMLLVWRKGRLKGAW